MNKILYQRQKETIKESVEKFYKEVNYLKKYSTLNLKSTYKLLKKYLKYLNLVGISDDNNFVSTYNENLLHTFIL